MGKTESSIRKPDRTSVPTVRNLTIFIPLSRPWRIDRMVEQLGKLNTDGFQTTLLFVVDNAEIKEGHITEAFDKYELPRYKTIFHFTNNPPASEHNANARRDRIKNVWLIAAEKVSNDADFVMTVEDDTDFDANALQALMSNYDNLTAAGKQVGLVSGVQVGRWGLKMIGAWRADNVEDPKVWETIPFTRTEILEAVDAAGFYCFVTPAHLFKSAKYEWGWFGCDVMYGLECRQKGFENFIDWTVETGHVMQHKTLRPDESCIVARYERDGEKWKLTAPKKGDLS